METPEQDPVTPAAEPLRNAKIKKPIYKRWWFLTIAALFVIVLILPKSNDTKTAEAAPAETGNVDYDSVRIAEAKAYFANKEQFFKDVSKDKVISAKTPKEYIEKLEEIQSTYRSHRLLEGKDKDFDKILAKEQKLVEAVLKNNYPNLRRELVDIWNKGLWESNVKVSASGTKSDEIIFTAAMFANNAAIRKFHDEIADNLSGARFKKATYRWYSGDSEPESFELNTANDTDF